MWDSVTHIGNQLLEDLLGQLHLKQNGFWAKHRFCWHCQSPFPGLKRCLRSDNLGFIGFQDKIYYIYLKFKDIKHITYCIYIYKHIKLCCNVLLLFSFWGRPRCVGRQRSPGAAPRVTCRVSPGRRQSFFGLKDCFEIGADPVDVHSCLYKSLPAGFFFLKGRDYTRLYILLSQVCCFLFYHL